jgi:hypothetical protein
MWEQLFEDGGWQVVGREDVRAVESVAYDAGYLDRVPEEVVGALRVVATTCNPEWSVEKFVWALVPVAEGKATNSRAARSGGADSSEQRHRIEEYLETVGLLASESNRRALALGPIREPRWRRTVRKSIASRPKVNAKVGKLLRRLG